jgi:G3E family GTPase
MTPLVVITGFLGAGKTTFLRDLLPLLPARGVTPVVIINDYMNALVDAAQVRDLAKAVLAVSGSCVCCGSRDELMDALATVDLPPNAAVLVEVNGTADPPVLLEFLAADKRAARFQPPVQVTVIDAERWQRRHWNNDIEAEQALTASYLQITRGAKVGAERVAEVEAGLRTRNPHATIVTPVAFADIVADLVRGRANPPSVALPREHLPHDAHHYAAIELPMPAAIARADLLRFLDALPDEVVRAKGVAFLPDEGGNAYLFQKIEGRGTAALMKLGTPEGLRPTVIFIGPRLPEATLRAAVQSLG